MLTVVSLGLGTIIAVLGIRALLGLRRRPADLDPALADPVTV